MLSFFGLNFLSCCCRRLAIVIGASSIAFVVAFGTPTLFGQDDVAWKVGDDFQRQLDSRIGFEWKSSPIRLGLEGIAKNQRVAIWLDRRIDPGFEVDLLVSNATLDGALQQVGSSISGGVSYVGAVAYVGPSRVTSPLATLAALRRNEVKRLPTAARTKFSLTEAAHWETLSVPRELVSDLVESAGAHVVNPELIPHDLWAAASWPTLPLTDQLTLLLAGFDLHFEIARDGSAIRLIAMPTEASIEQSYAPRGSLTATASAISKAFPGIGVKKSGARLLVSGTYEQHQDVARLVRGEPLRPNPQPTGEKLFDLRVENELVGGIIKAIANREMLEVKASPAVVTMLTKRVSFDVKQLSLDELLARTLNGTGITFQINGSTLELRSSQ